MKKKPLSLPGWILLCVCLLVPSQLLAYDYYRNANGQPRRWKGGLISWYLNTSGLTKIPQGQVENAFKKAFTAWQQIKCARLTFAYRGTTTTLSNSKDGKNVISFSYRGPGLLTVMYMYDSKGNFSDVDVKIAPNQAWSLNPQGSQYDMQSVAMTVVGHIIGLKSVSSPKEATMYEIFNAADISKRTLHPDDISGACFLYPSGLPQCAVDTDCPPGLRCKSQKCVLAPPAPVSKLCKACSSKADCNQGGDCLFIGSGSYCSQPCTADGLCPTNYICDGMGVNAQCLPQAGKCPTQSCQSDADCPATLPKCKAGKCSPECSSDAECKQKNPNKPYCYNGRCVVSQGCMIDSDCKNPGEKCVNGQCTSGPTTCTPGASKSCTCPDGSQKKQTCKADGSGWDPATCPCGSSQVCTPGKSRQCSCAGGKQGNQTCNADGKGWGQCNCGSGTICVAGSTQACTCTDGKKGSQTCNSDGKSWGQCNCQSSNVCAPGATQACVCTDGKKGSQSCNSDGKSWGQCTCQSSNVCAPGATQACTCTNGKQGSQTCNSDGMSWGQCSCGGNPPVCTNGEQQPCTCADGKQGNQSCTNGAWGQCSCGGNPPPKSCSTDAECTNGTKCYNGQCSAGMPCKSAVNCPQGQICNNGFCQEDTRTQPPGGSCNCQPTPSHRPAPGLVFLTLLVLLVLRRPSRRKK